MPKITVNYGKNILETTIQALRASDILDYLKKGMSVSLKPNLVLSRPADQGATTHPEVLEGIITFLREVGIENIKIIESSWVGDNTKRAYKNCGYSYLTEKYSVPLIDLKDDKFIMKKAEGYTMEVCREALETDFLINIPVLKAHCQTLLTCNMKNLKGCISDREKRKFHTQGIHGPVAALNKIISTGYCVVDGVCGDLTFEEGGNPVLANRIITGRNPLYIDSYCANLIGYKPEEIEYLAIGKKLGIGEFYMDSDEILELNADNKPKVSTISNNGAKKYAAFIEEDSACSACYSALVFALRKAGTSSLGRNRVKIGQGFKGKTGGGFGVGNCTCGIDKYVTGCPPKALDIVRALEP